jgi:hypothetical protein
MLIEIIYKKIGVNSNQSDDEAVEILTKIDKDINI